MKKIINLRGKLFGKMKALGHYDGQFSGHWAKHITNVDPNGSNGYAFEGKFVPDGDVEVEVGNRLFLLMTTTGSRKYPVKHYRLVIMNTDCLLYTSDAADE